MKLGVWVQAEMELWKASGPEVRGPNSNTTLILAPLVNSSLNKTALSDPNPTAAFVLVASDGFLSGSRRRESGIPNVRLLGRPVSSQSHKT